MPSIGLEKSTNNETESKDDRSNPFEKEKANLQTFYPKKEGFLVKGNP